jgi:cytochrome c553
MAQSSKIHAVWICCLLGVVACVSAPSGKYVPVVTPEMALQKNLERQLALVNSDEAVRQQLNQAMKFRTQLCQRCHGVDGHSRNGRCPNLAGQSPAYLVQQLQHFGDGRRQDFQMQSVASKMTDNDKVAVAIYFSSMPPRPAAEEIDELASRGESIFRTRCAQCHGVQGQGQYTYPRLAGQLPGYISMTLYEFRKPASRRRITIMREIASTLSEAEIKAVAAYISTMK